MSALPLSLRPRRARDGHYSGGLLTAAFPPTAPKPTVRPAPPLKPPLNFSGTWGLDAAASRGVTRSMQGALLSVTQTGHRILIEPILPKQPTEIHAHLAADLIVADGRTYEKTVGPKTKGQVTTIWSPDGTSLRMEITAGTKENPRASVQRSIWTMSKDRNVWVRQSVTFQNGKTTSARLVFRRRPKP